MSAFHPALLEAARRNPTHCGHSTCGGSLALCRDRPCRRTFEWWLHLRRPTGRAESHSAVDLLASPESANGRLRPFPPQAWRLRCIWWLFAPASESFSRCDEPSSLTGLESHLSRGVRRLDLVFSGRLPAALRRPVCVPVQGRQAAHLGLARTKPGLPRSLWCSSRNRPSPGLNV